MSVNQAVMEKLAKILRLANNSAATPGEVEAAMARAKEIAIQNNIELASVDFTDPNTKAKGIDVATDADLKLGVAFYRKYHTWVFHVVQTVFGVRFITSRHKQGSRERITKIYIIGEVTDVAIAKVMFSWLEQLYPKSYQAEVKAFRIPIDNAAMQHGYYRGLTYGILEANRKEEEKVKQGADSGKWAMVVRNKETAIQAAFEQQFPDVTASKAKQARNESATAAALGYQKGKSINLNQVGAGAGNAGQSR